MNHKYTNDGKKVAVIGKLNSTEYIVQEIFVSEGSEIPSGEQFVVKSLHEKPVVSWKEKETKKIEEHYNRVKTEYDRKRNELYRKQENIIKALSEKISQLSHIKNNISEDAFYMISDFLLQKNKYAVTVRYGWRYEIIEWDFEKEISSMWDGRFDGLKLVSLFGKSNGDLQFNVNEYRDGSGTNSSLYLFRTFEAAKSFYVEKIKDKKYDKDIIEQHKKWGIPLDEEKLTAFKNSQKESIQNIIKKKESEISKLTKDLDEIDLNF